LWIFNVYRHDISIFALNCNKNSLNTKLHVNSICANECLCMMQIFFVHLNIKFNFKIKFKEILKYGFVIMQVQYMWFIIIFVNKMLIYKK
jgi:hypothetical protein